MLEKGTFECFGGFHPAQHFVNHFIGRFGMEIHTRSKVLICSMKSLECIVLTLLILPIVLGFVCIPDVSSSSAYRSDLTVSNTHDFSVAAVSGGDDSELARHRRGTYSIQSELLGVCQRSFCLSAQKRQR